jgi:predicted DNA-binding antitoxin AbrB/MazE fold protein
MYQNITAVYEKGTLILDEPLEISDGSEVEIVLIERKNLSEKSPAELLAEIASLPTEGKGEVFSSRDHDRILYGKVDGK